MPFEQGRAFKTAMKGVEWA